MTMRARSWVAILVFALLMGRVTDITTGQPLIGVRVTLAGPQRGSATTDREGRYRITGLRPGTYRMTLVSSDVPVQRRTVAVGRVTTLDIKACSTTLDYSCGAPTEHSGPGGSGK
jgi:hypothetical protein